MDCPRQSDDVCLLRVRDAAEQLGCMVGRADGIRRSSYIVGIITD